MFILPGGGGWGGGIVQRRPSVMSPFLQLNKGPFQKTKKKVFVVRGKPAVAQSVRAHSGRSGRSLGQVRPRWGPKGGGGNGRSLLASVGHMGLFPEEDEAADDKWRPFSLRSRACMRQRGWAKWATFFFTYKSGTTLHEALLI